MARATLRIVGVLAQAGISVLAGAALAADECASPVGTLVSVQGIVDVQRAGSAGWLPIALGAALCAGDLLRVGERSRIEAGLVNQVKIRGDQNTTLRLISPPEERVSWLDLFSGGAYFFSRQPRSLNVNTPFVNAAVEGTEFQIRVADDHTDIGVFNGTILARNSFGEVTLRSGRSSIATASAAPTDVLTIRPFDAVQWALYFPPVLAKPPADIALPAALREAIELADQGRTTEAFRRFAEVPDAGRDATFYLYRAQTLLSVGRVDEAEADLRQVLAREPDNAAAYGVQAVIAVSRNEQDEALRLAQRAVELAPTSAAAQIALSYAEQSRFRIEAARDALQQAVADEPENALAWARLSELWLMLGYRNRAVQTARRARDLAPDLGRVQTVLGFAALAEIDTTRAAEAFRRAIDLDQANPMPRFGLGLATIRDGNLREGRADIESAVLLDPNNSLLRSYLGKAYFEERTTNPLKYFRELVENFPNQENRLAAEQYGLAKQLDPNDPTPWFYDAIRKQSENRPVEALQDLEKSIKLNDNRAVFRSRELLDIDRASRGASLARIYNDLGFEQLGINEATKSLAYDPSNAGAHRFLSDVYATQPRREIARVSELLQAQLLQDININPVQPSLSITNLNGFTSAGPSRPGFDEFTSLFERNQAQLNVSGAIGSNYSNASEAVVSGIYDVVSISAGQFHSETDGFRKNSNVTQDAYNFFIQSAITPELNVQSEFLRRTAEEGDLRFNFDADAFSTIRHRDLDQDMFRVGARYTPLPNLNLITSLIYATRHAKLVDEDGFFVDTRGNQNGIQGEAQVLIQQQRSNLVVGANAYDINTKNRIDLPEFDTRVKFDSTIDQQTIYLYYNAITDYGLSGTLGFSYDDYNHGNFDNQNYHKTNYSPKIGLRWDVSDAIRIRLATFQSIKPALLANRTIQPTQVAGFNQFFDGINGTSSWNYGVGIDVRPTEVLYSGLEVSWRDIDIPAVSIGNENTNNWTQQNYRAYLYWRPDLNWTIETSMQYDIFGSNSTSPPSIPFLSQVKTLQVPVGVRYFSPSGFFGTVLAAFVHQDVDKGQTASRPEGNNEFLLLDASIGYRLPQRRGLISIEGRNLLNEGFKYQDDSYLTNAVATDQPNTSVFIPERAVIARVTLNF